MLCHNGRYNLIAMKHTQDKEHGQDHKHTERWGLSPMRYTKCNLSDDQMTVVVLPCKGKAEDMGEITFWLAVSTSSVANPEFPGPELCD